MSIQGDFWLEEGEYISTTLREKFAEYLEKNPKFWPMFVHFTKQAVLVRGRRKISAWLIVNRMRWEVWFDTVDNHYPFKISNDYIALCARKFLAEHPECGSCFNLKPMRRV